MFTFKLIVTETLTGKNETIEGGTRENAQLISSHISAEHYIEMTDPKGGVWKFGGLNAWAHCATIIGD